MFGLRSVRGSISLAKNFTSARFRRGMTGKPVGSPEGRPAGQGEDEGGTSAGQFAGHGMTFVVAVLGGLYLGQWLDRRLGTDPWLLIVGVFTGAGAAFWSMYSKLMAAQAREDAARAARKTGQERK
jgi:ATP synthase protein I